MPSRDLYVRMKTAIDAIPVIDSHEHLYLPEEDWRAHDADFCQFLFQYNLDDLMTAGMEVPDTAEFVASLGKTLRIGGRALSTDEKWRRIKPYWEASKYTGYGRAARLSLGKLFGADDLTDDTYGAVSERLPEFLRPGVMRSILADTCGFEGIINDVDVMVQPGMFERLDRTLYRFVARFRHFSYIYFPNGVETVERMFGMTIRSLDHLEDAIDAQFERWEAEGRVALKMADAYLRDIHYEDSTRDEAERVFRRIFTLRKHPRFAETLSFAEARPLENWALHRILERAEAHALPVIVHTGVQAYTGDDPSHSRASLLVNLFRKYPGLRFHLLHANYPWMGEAACLAKQFPNVSLDLTWVHVIVPSGAREGLSQILDSVPLNKIHGFGGDCLLPLNVWGALEVARENIAHVLADKVEIGHMTESGAIAIAERLMNGNIREIFHLG